MRLRLTFQRTETKPEAELFGGIPRGRPIWRTFLGSICGHAAVVWFAFSYVHFLTTTSPDVAQARLRPRVLDISFHLYDPPRLHPEAAKPASAPGSESSGAKLRAPSAAEVGVVEVPESRTTEILRQFKLPQLPQASKVTETLVQLDLPLTVDLHQELRVPSLILLSEKKQRLPPKPFVAPPERKRTPEVPNAVVLDAQAPVLEAHAGHAKMPEVLAHTPPPLPTPAGAISPISTSREATPSNQTATITAEVPGDDVNIISLPNRPIPAASSIVLPAINQVAERDAGGTGGGSQAASGAGRSVSSGTGSANGAAGIGNLVGLRAASQPGGTGAEAGGQGTGGMPTPGVGGIGSGGIIAVLNDGHGRGDGAGTRDGASEGAGAGVIAGIANNGSKGTSTINATRVEHPKGGHYEVAVVQSTGVVPGSAGLLEGRPVYSVYVAVGGRKEWILQYCVRSSRASPQPSQVVQLGPITAVSAPYAYTIMRPAVQFRSAARYGFVHGFVNLSGRFEQLREAGEPAIENIEPVLESLQMWEFRPAAKDGVATAVEILLCIPNAGL